VCFAISFFKTLSGMAVSRKERHLAIEGLTYDGKCV